MKVKDKQPKLNKRMDKMISNLQKHYSRLILRLKHSKLYIQAKPIVLKHERIFSTLLIILLFIPTILIIEPLIVRNEVEAAWYDTNWSFRERIPLTNTSGSDQTNWQTQITFDTSTLISNGKMLSTCNDIRFTNNNGKLLPYWIEPNTCNNASTKIWIKVDSIPTTGANIYIYYGNPSSASANYKTSDVFIRDMTSSTATWPLDDTVSTQSYSRVTNPAVATGRNLVLNGTFDSSSSWTTSAGWSISGGVATNTPGVAASLIQALPIIAGKVYSVTFTISNYSAGTLLPQVGNSGNGTAVSANGTYTQTIIASGNTNFLLTANSTFSGSVDNVSVTQVNIPSSGATPTQLLTDGNMETAGTSSWTAGSNATLTKDSVSPHAGTQSLKVAYNGTVTPFASQTVLTVGQVYRVYGYYHGDGTVVPKVQDGSAAVLATGTSSTTWQPFDVVFVAQTTTIRLVANSTGISWFDDVTVSLDTGIRSDQILSTLDGDMEQSGTSYWSAQAGILTKDTSPHGGTQDLRITQTGSGTLGAFQLILVAGKTYYIQGWYMTDGTTPAKISTQTTGVNLSPASPTSWTFFTHVFTAGQVTDPHFYLQGSGSAGAWVEFDDVSVTELDPLTGQPNNGVSFPTTANGHLTNAYSFDGTNDNVNIYSSDLNSAFNPSEGTLVAWAKVSGSGVWTDGTPTRNIVDLDSVFATNEITLQKNGNNTLRAVYAAGGTFISVTNSSFSSTGWFQTVITWSKSSDQVKMYVNGAQVGSTQTGLGTWTGNFGSTTAVIGAFSTTGTTSPWSGLINDVHLYGRALSSSEISDLYGTGTVDRQSYYTENYPGHELITQTATTLTVSAPAAEEVGSAPILWYKLDDATGTIAHDSSSNANNGTLGGTTIPSWQDETQCALTKCLYFDGQTSKVTGSKVASNIKSIGFWIRPLSSVASLGIMNLDGGTHTIQTNSSGVITATGFTSPTYYVNGYATTNPLLSTNTWNYVEITTNTSFSSTNSFTIGTDGTNFTSGYIDEVKFFNYVRTGAQAQTDFNGVSSKIAAFKPYTWNSNLVASWLLQDSTSTQSYSTVTNPALATGRNIIVNPTPTSSTSWILNANWAYANNLFTHTTGSTAQVQQQTPAVLGKVYSITYTVSGMTAGAINVSLGAGGASRNANGTYTDVILSTQASGVVVFSPTSTFDGSISNFIMTQLNIPSSSATPTQLLTDGNMEAAGTSSWTAAANATLSKQTTTPHSGSQLLRVARNGTNNPQAFQTVLTVGQVYRAYGYVRSDGSATPVFRDNSTIYFTGTTSTTWQPFDVVFVALGTNSILQCTTSTGTQYCEFDDVTVAVDNAIRPDQILSTLDGDMEQSGTSYWTVFNTATLTKDSTNPHSGTQSLKIAVNGTAHPAAAQSVLVVGKTYRVTGWALSDGTAVPRLENGAVVYWSGSTATSWTFFDTTFVAQTNNVLRFSISNVPANGSYIEFDDIALTELDPLSGLPTNGVTLGATANGHLTNAYSFDGTNDNVNIYSSDLNSAFNPSEGTVVMWAKVSASGVWSDATGRRLLFIGDQASGTNSVQIHRVGATNGGLEFDYGAGGSTSLVTYTTSSPTGWFQVVITWSKSNDQVKAYFNGSQVGSTQNGLGTWAANLGSSTVAIGASGSSGSNSWSGLINDVNLYNRALTPNEISQIYNGANASSAGPVGYWKFDERTGTNVNDYSTNGNTGTWNGTLGSQWKTGKYGAAGNFNGSDNEVSIPNNAIFNSANTLTVSAWVKPSVVNLSHQTIFRNDAANGDRGFFMELRNNNATMSVFNGVSHGASGTIALSAGTWYYLTGTYDGATLKIYVNGVLDASTSTTGNITSSALPLIIGAYTTGTNHFQFSGSIDDAKIYNYARSPQQILEDMQAAPNATEISGSATSTKPNTAIGEWKFDEGYGTTANNSGSGGSTLNGTLTNMSSPATSTSGWQIGTNNCKYTNCLAFDGTDDFVSTGSNQTMSTSDFSITLWAKATSFNNLRLFSNRNFNDNTDPGFEAFLYASGRPGFRVNDGTTTTTTADAGTVLSTGTWYHFAFILANNDKLYVYVNGKLYGSIANSSAGSKNAVHAFLIGAGYGTSSTKSAFWSGSIDDVKVFTGALTSDEVKEEYNATSAINYGTGTNEGNNFASGAGNAPVGDWEFEEPNGSSINDSSGNGGAGTLHGVTPNRVAGKIGAAINFNPTSITTGAAWVQLATDTALSPGSGDQTISFWFKTASSYSSVAAIYGNWGAGSNLVKVSMDTSNKIQCFFEDGSSNILSVTSTGALNNGSWHYVSCAKGGTTANLYIDGNKNNSATNASIGTITLNGTNIGFGANLAGAAGNYTGQLDHLLIYNYARTQDQVAYDYNRGLPVGWWKLDECQGSTVHDSSGNNNSGTITIGGTGTQTLAGNCNTSSTAWGNGATGKYNYSLNFDGTDDYVDVGSSSMFNFGSNNFTYSAWVKYTASGTAPRIIAQDNNSNNVRSLSLNGTNKATFACRDASNNSMNISGTTSLNDSAWHLVTGVRNGSTSLVYVDGKLEGTTTNALVGSCDGGVSTKIGARIVSASVSLPFTGQIDDVRIYNYALTAKQVKLLYDNGSAVFYGPLTGSP